MILMVPAAGLIECRNATSPAEKSIHEEESNCFKKLNDSRDDMENVWRVSKGEGQPGMRSSSTQGTTLEPMKLHLTWSFSLFLGLVFPISNLDTPFDGLPAWHVVSPQGT